jgi:peptidoglycan hydrolase-like protein with peptidoglycan-binding domain
MKLRWVLLFAAAAALAAGADITIQQAQKILKQKGYYSGEINGVNGPQTEAAIGAFQKDQGLKITGALDENTTKQLTGGVGLAPSGDLTVRQAQKSLKDKGYYSGEITGVNGPETEAAIGAFQKDQGLKITGTLDGKTSKLLHPGPETENTIKGVGKAAGSDAASESKSAWGEVKSAVGAGKKKPPQQQQQ